MHYIPYTRIIYTDEINGITAGSVTTGFEDGEFQSGYATYEACKDWEVKSLSELGIVPPEYAATGRS